MIKERNPIVSLTSLFTYGGSGYYGTSQNSVTLETAYSARKGVTTSDYRYRRKLGLPLPQNGYETFRGTKSVPVQAVTLRVSEFVAQAYGNYCVPNWTHLPLPNAKHTELLDACIGKCGGRLNGTQFSIPLFTRDFNSTVKMFEKTVKTITKTVRRISTHPKNAAYARMRRRRPGGTPIQIGENEWLEYRYGWRLLLKDLYDSMCAVYDRLTRGVATTIKVGSDYGATWNRPYVASQCPSYADAMATLGVADCENVVYFQTILTLTVKDVQPALSSLQQFGITNPASFLWDAIPLSFVLDWVFSVGDYLRSLDVFVGKKFVSGCVSYLYTIESTCKIKSLKGYGSWGISSFSAPPTVIKERSYKRVPLDTFPTASLPHIDVNLNKSRVLDGLALIKQLSPLIFRK